MALAAVTLDDKYTLERGRVYLTGTQALVRLPMMQRQRDVAAGLNTGCFISGYRGSPLGGFDQALWSARRFLERNHIKFQPGDQRGAGGDRGVGQPADRALSRRQIRRRLCACGTARGRASTAAATRSSTAIRPARRRMAACWLLAGDDHTCKSSTLAHQSEFAFIDAAIPVLNPAGVQEILDLGLYGWAMSRYSGCWVALQDRRRDDGQLGLGRRSIPERIEIVLPDDFEMPPGGLNIRWPDPPLDQEDRLHRYKLYAALAFARANRLDRIVIDSPRPRFGIVTTGKSYLDVRQALDDLGIDDARCRRDRHAPLQGRRCPGRSNREGIRAFRRGARGDPGRRGKARGHREPAEGAALQLAGRRRAPARRRQVRREPATGSCRRTAS